MEEDMTPRSARSIASVALLAGMLATPVAAQPRAMGRIDVPPVPANLEVPDGHSVFLHGYAIGTQNYICLATAAGMGWAFIGPEATLFATRHGEPVHQTLTHYLSATPFEVNLLRPVWQHSRDSSRIWGRAAASSSDPAYVETGAIPWLLLDVAGAEAGPEGGDVLAQATFIHRLNTSGGSKPANGCSEPREVGSLNFVPYRADYYFYRATRHK
jgi:hypothetical protein